MTTCLARHAARLSRALLVAALALAAGCENVLDVIPQDGLRGLVVLDTQSGAELARYLATTQTSTGSVSVGVGSSRVVRIAILGGSGETIPIAGSYVLREPAVVTAALATASKEGTDRVRITGVRTGNTALILDVEQGLQTVIPLAEIPIRVGP